MACVAVVRPCGHRAPPIPDSFFKDFIQTPHTHTSLLPRLKVIETPRVPYPRDVAKAHHWTKENTCKDRVKEPQRDPTLFIFGGLPNPDLWYRFDTQSREWQKRKAPISERYGSCSATIRGQVYIIGGRSMNTIHSSVECVSTNSDDVITTSPMKCERYGAAAVAVSGYIYVIGGCSECDVLRSAERYDPKVSEWSRVADMKKKRYAPAVAAADGFVYVFGGRNEGGVLNSVERYRPDTNEWSYGTPMPSPCYGAKAVVHSNFVFVLGGCDEGGRSLRSVAKYDLRTQCWTRVTSMIHPHSFFGCYVTDRKIFVIGGYGQDLPQSYVESFDSEKWSEEQSLGFSIAECACESVLS